MKKNYSNLLLIIKTTLCLTILLTINNEPAQSADFLDDIMDETNSITDTISNSLEDQIKQSEIYFSDSLDKLGDYTSEAIKGAGDFFINFMDDFESKRNIFEEAGFYLKSANLYIDFPPKISLTFKNGKILDETKYTDLQNSLSDTPTLKVLLNILVSMRKIKSEKYIPAETVVKFGLPPAVHLTFPLGKK